MCRVERRLYIEGVSPSSYYRTRERAVFCKPLLDNAIVGVHSNIVYKLQYKKEVKIITSMYCMVFQT